MYNTTRESFYQLHEAPLLTIANLTNFFFQHVHNSPTHSFSQKPNFDFTSPANYRPISNLPTISKIIGKVILMQLQTHITNNQNDTSHQSASQPSHWNSSPSRSWWCVSKLWSQNCFNSNFTWLVSSLITIYWLIASILSLASKAWRWSG